MQIKITGQAKSDIVSIRKYIARNNKTASINFTIKLKEIFIILSNYPKIGKSRVEFEQYNIYSFVFNKYIIVYKLNNTDIEILRILSKYQDYLKFFS